MRRIASSFFLVLLALSFCAGRVNAYPAEWYDTNKYWDTLPTITNPDDSQADPVDLTDSLMCWAATASNVLKYTGWGLDSNGDGVVSPQTDMYHEFLKAFPNDGGYGYLGYESYFSWHYPGKNYEDYYVQIFRDLDNPNYIIDQMKWLLSDTGNPDDPYLGDYGLYLSVYGHAVTAWDIKPVLLPNSDAELYDIYITDSDDEEYSLKSYRLEKRWEKWFLQDYYGQDYSHFLNRIEALAFKPGLQVIGPGGIGIINPINLTPVHTVQYYYALTNVEPDGPRSPALVPEPATMLLFSTGLIGAFIRRKRKV
ncbi:MAG: PEP-CTERM sorting domain-containing protein [Thermodesulfobacteriota bacterium]|nr:PEP-CTERM sorting domain-containing protein [Thermodesulfobacteriota bacterium]